MAKSAAKTGRALDQEAYERLQEQIAVAIVQCSDAQILDLADSLHAALRRRRYAAVESRSWSRCPE